MNGAKWTHEKTVVIKTHIISMHFNMLVYNESFRRIRRDIDSPVNGCGLCDKPFEDGQYMHLAYCTGLNQMCCDSCANEAVANGVPSFIKKEV